MVDLSFSFLSFSISPPPPPPPPPRSLQMILALFAIGSIPEARGSRVKTDQLLVCSIPLFNYLVFLLVPPKVLFSWFSVNWCRGDRYHRPLLISRLYFHFLLYSLSKHTRISKRWSNPVGMLDDSRSLWGIFLSCYPIVLLFLFPIFSLGCCRFISLPCLFICIF